MSHQRLPYLAGNKRDVDHEFWKLVTQAGGMPDRSSNRPAGVSSDTYLKWVWRVKSWKLSGNLSFFLDGEFTPTTISFSLTDQTFSLQIAPGTTPAASEKDIVHDFAGTFSNSPRQLQNYGAILPITIFPVIATSSNPGVLVVSAQAAVQANIFQYENFTVHETGLDQYWPVLRLQVNSNVVVHYVASGHEFTIATAWNTGGVATGVVGGTGLVMDGVTVPMYSNYPQPPITADLVIAPTEFWEYRNSLGQPVYDASTGAQINDPFA